MSIRQRISGPPLHRAVSEDATVVDKDRRLIRLSFSSEEVVVERSSFWDDAWIERLGHDDGEVDLSFLNSGSAPVLWAHDRWTRDAMVGVIERAWIENKRGYVDIRLSGRADVEGLLQDIQDGIVKNVSVGYRILERVLVTQNKDGASEYRVTLWKPFEISFLPVPADEGVGVGRSDDADGKQRFTVTTIEERIMADKVQNPPAPPADEQQRQTGSAGAGNPTPAVSADTEQHRAAGAKAERQRTADILALGRDHNLDDDFVRTAIDEGHTIEQFRAATLERLKAGQKPNRPQATIVGDEQDKSREAAENWLLRKGGEKVDDKLIQGNPFVGASLQDVARSRLDVAGKVRTAGLYGDALARAAVSSSTSDFPVLMENVMHKTMRAEHKLASDTWRSIAVVGTVSDYRPSNSYAAGGIEDLKDVGENGVIQHGKLNDGEREQVSVKPKGIIITLTKQMIINDELGVFLQLARKLGRSGARSIENLVYATLLANPTLKSDGKAIFHVDHKNLNASGGAPTMARFDAIFQALANQKDVGGNDFIDIGAAVWLGGLTHRGAAMQVNESANDPDASNKNIPNIAKGLFSKIVATPRVTGNQWYGFADPNIEPVLQVSFLNGQQEPQTEMEEQFEVLGIRWRATHDFGVDPVGYRGAQKVTW